MSPLAARIQKVRTQLAEQVGREEDEGKRRSTFIYLLRLGAQIGRQWVKDKCPQAASSLAYETSLSLVPLMAVGFALLKATGAFNERSALMTFLTEQILPISKGDLVAKLTAFADNIGVGALGATGVVSMIFLAYLLFHTVEHIYNDIWHVEKRRSLASKLMVFFALTIIPPFLMGISLAHTLPIWQSGRVAEFFIPLGATVTALTLQNKLMPSTKVYWRPALAGGLVSGILLEAAKHLFSWYVSHVAFARYSGVYGPLGLVALLLVWIYVCWLLVLFGAEVAHAAQNLSELEGRSPSELVSAPVATRLLLLVAAAARAGTRPPTSALLYEQLDAPARIVEELLTRLERAELVRKRGRRASEGGWELGREPREISLHDILILFRAADLPRPAGGTTKLDEALAELHDSERKLSGRVTLDDLLG